VNYLFIHQNFPGQFKHLAPALAAQPGNTVATLTLNAQLPATWAGVRVFPYRLPRGTTQGIHPWVADIETKTIRGEACFRAALQLKEQGFTPDVIIAHPGWGESLFLDEVWPQARIAMYCEFYYRAVGADVGFDPEFPNPDPGDVCRLRLKNVNNLLHFETVHAGISPTHWQASTFPEPFRSRISVIHDGIDTGAVVPNPKIELGLGSGVRLSRRDEVITFVNRNLEPTRGYHIFMRALPKLLAARPKARVIIVGGDDVSYGARPKDGLSYKERYLQEVSDRIDRSRVHFVGHIPYDRFVGLLQLSTVHVYLTYPFVLSWSLLEAMSAGCAIVASDTQPLREAIRHGETGVLVDFFDHDAIADRVCELLDSPQERARLGGNARAFAVANYDLRTICLPRQLMWVKSLSSANKL
jgi:glycosyltransferase involved in cell wall biosynthesis